MKPDKVLALLAKGKREEALTGLIATWQASPATEIADAIDAIDTIEMAPSAELDTKAWKKAAKASTAATARGALIRGIHGRTLDDTVACLEVAVTWRDPRVFTVVRELLETLPWTGRRSTGQWRKIFDVLAELGDPRTHALVQTLPPKWTVGEPLQTFLPNRLRECVAGIGAAVSAPAYAAIVIAKPAAPASKSKASEAELLAAIYDHPDDDGPRLVYADWLQERSDPRGEFIALQLRGELDAAATKRERELVKKHGKAWLGPIAKALHSEVTWRRGFPVKGIVKLRNQRDVETYCKDASWGTFEELTWSIGDNVISDQLAYAGYIGPAMKNLRVAVQSNWRFVLESPVPWARLEVLGLEAEETGVDGFHAVLAARDKLPKLRSYWMVGWGAKPEWLDKLAWTPPQLETNTSLEDDEILEWLATAAKLPTLESFMIHAYRRYTCTFTRDAKKKFTKLAFEVSLYGTDTLADNPGYVTELKTVVAKFSKKYSNERSAVAIDRRGVRHAFPI